MMIGCDSRATLQQVVLVLVHAAAVLLAQESIRQDRGKSQER